MDANADLLIVDDLPENLAVLSSILKNAGYKVRSTLSGELALKAVALAPPALILLDVMMPNMDGYEVCRRLKAAPHSAEIPVLFISALDDPQAKVKALTQGGVDFITKPFDAHEVLARVSVHLELRRATARIQEQNTRLEDQNIRLSQALADLKAAQSNMVSSAKMASLGVLTAGIAHELNNPLNFVYANAQTSLKMLRSIEDVLNQYETLTPENAAEQLPLLTSTKARTGYHHAQEGLGVMLEGIRIGAERAAKIVSGLRLFTRGQGDNEPPSAFDLHQNIEAALTMMASTIGHHVQIVRDFQTQPMLIGQAGALNQVFVNLIGNATDAMSPTADEIARPSTLTLRTEDCQREGVDWVKIEISDTGKGFDAETHAHLFEPFFTTKAVGKGTGLGLSISHGLVARQQGILEAESQLGHGATFRVLLPRQSH